MKGDSGEQEMADKLTEENTDDISKIVEEKTKNFGAKNGDNSLVSILLNFLFFVTDRMAE